MSNTKLSATIIAFGLFLIACNTDQPRQTANVQPVVNSGALTAGMFDANDYWAKDNLDLQRVGDLLERSNSPQEFEGYLNSSDGINNLDLNGDGYVDYISVDEYQDRDDNSRGLSIFSRFGPDLVQEIAQVILYRDEPRYPGARIALYGNDQIYGDNQYYETNWLDRSLGIAKLLFGSRDTYYRSPYYYNQYPEGYRPYQVVETPYYRTRIEQLYPRPVFTYTANPVWFTRVKIKSPNNGLHLGQIKARFVKPTKEQAEFIKNNPGRPPFVKADKADKDDKGDKGGKKDDVAKPEGQPKDDRKADTDKGNGSKPDKVKKQDVEKPDAKPDRGGKDTGKGSGKGSDKGKKP